MTDLVEAIGRQLDFNHRYAEKLVEDVSDSDMTHDPSPGLENHPAITLGHLAISRMLLISLHSFFTVPSRGNFRRPVDGGLAKAFLHSPTTCFSCVSTMKPCTWASSHPGEEL